MRQKLINWIHNLGSVTGIFYMLIPLKFLNSIDDNYYNWILFLSAISYDIFYYKKFLVLSDK